MTTPRTITRACGCVSTWSDLDGQYHVKHTCDPKARSAQKLAQIRADNDAAARRRYAPLHNSQGFRLLR